MDSRVIVVGGGAAGLAAAYTLRKRAVDFILLEASDRAGGRMFGEVVDGFYIDSGACVFHETQDTVNRFCNELGISFDKAPRGHVGTIHSNGKSYRVNMDRMRSIENIKTLLSFKLFSPKEIIQVAKFAKILKGRRDDFDQKDYTRLLDLDTGENLVEFIERHSGKEFANGAFLESFINVAALSTPQRMGALQGVILMWDFIFGYPRKTVRNPDECIAAFAMALAGTCQDNTRLSTPIERILIENDAIQGVLTSSGEMLEADHVICATTASAALQMMPDLPDNISGALSRVSYSSCCHVAFGVDGNPLPKPTYVFSFVPRTDSFLAAYFDSTIASPLSAPPGKGVIHGYATEEYSEELMAMRDEEIKRRFITEIQKYAPDMPDEPLFTRIHRWEEAVYMAPGGVMTELYELRQQGFPGVAGLSLAGEYMNMMGVNGALTSGVVAADEVADSLGAVSG